MSKNDPRTAFEKGRIQRRNEAEERQKRYQEVEQKRQLENVSKQKQQAHLTANMLRIDCDILTSYGISITGGDLCAVY